MPKRAPSPPAGPRLEVHEHAFISGPRANGMFVPTIQKTTSHIRHSHLDGSVGHEHPDTGPGRLDIDKDDWYAATGLRGGGRKAFTWAPSGEQLAYVARTPEQQTFTVVFCDEYSDEHVRAGISLDEHQRAGAAFKAAARGEIPDEISGQPGDGGAAVANVALSFGMTPVYRYDGPKRRRRGGGAASS